MPGRTPYEAFSAFVTPLADALKCVTWPKVATSPGGTALLDRKHNLHLTGPQGENDGYLLLRGEDDLEFRARMFYQIIEDRREGYGPYRCTTLGYDYSVRKPDGAAVVDYHWHPIGLSHERRPHIHLGSSQLRPDAVLSNKQHMLTGRTTLESVIRNLIGLGVRPRYPDWAAQLDICEGPHILYRTWTNDYEQETGRKVADDEAAPAIP
ncbi:hypothetical protein [Plantactinospora sp. WMMB782]|uniref:hypothetical protein n=1 Tax=Plantactinospora sp. WMMB782 TaxID=3404121 RepID=UPI003B9561B4